MNKFNWKIYVKYNKLPDNVKTYKTALEHYNHVGKQNSNLIYCIEQLMPPNFNWETYKSLNPDLASITNKKDAIKHFLRFGTKEKRQYYPGQKQTITSKETFRHECVKELTILKNIELPPIKLNQNKEMVFIEFRWFEHIELLLRNAILKFSDWSHTVICGSANGEIMKNCCNFISPNIKVIVLQIDNCTQSEYSKLLMSVKFWNLFYGETILIHQEDSYIFHNNINEFLKYDYVGAPWPAYQDDNDYGVGNGGFSLRTKSKMIEVINKVSVNDIIMGKHTTKYMNHTKNTTIPEDVYFSQSLINHKIGNVSPRRVASKFSQETQLSKRPLGGHNFFLAGQNLDIDRYEGLLLAQDYYKSVDHRGGWKTVINYGISNKIISKTNKESIIFIDCCEKYFIWDKLSPIKTKWIGIIHSTPATPAFLYETLGIDILLKNDNFKHSLKTCVGIVGLTKYQTDYIDEFFFTNHYKNIPATIAVSHPVEPLTRTFDLDKFKSFNEYNILLLGQQLRKITDMLKIIKTPLIKDKIWLSGIKDETTKNARIMTEIDGLGLSKQDYADFCSTIRMPYLDNHRDYDELIQNSIIFVPLFDSSANNSVLECIISNTPAFIQKNKGTIEYLGEKYPLFFDDIDEVNDILKDREQLIDKMENTHIYLKNLDKSNFTNKHFYSDILIFINNLYF